MKKETKQQMIDYLNQTKKHTYLQKSVYSKYADFYKMKVFYSNINNEDCMIRLFILNDNEVDISIDKLDTLINWYYHVGQLSHIPFPPCKEYCETINMKNIRIEFFDKYSSKEELIKHIKEQL